MKLAKKIKKKETRKKPVLSKERRISMKRQISLLKDVFVIVAGENSDTMVDLLYGHENVNEFDIAKKMKLTINQARNILYKLTEKGMVNFIRKKDKKNGGWYTYFWTLDVNKSITYLKERFEKEIEYLDNHSHSLRSKQFYFCENCDGVEMSEETALLHDFACPECGEVLKSKDSGDEIQRMKDKIEQLKKKIVLIDEELHVIEKKDDAKRERKRKAEIRKKKIAREKKRKERAELRKKEEKKSPKKKTKKIVKVKSKKKKIAVQKRRVSMKKIRKGKRSVGKKKRK